MNTLPGKGYDMDVIAEYGKDDLAKVYVARLHSSQDRIIEFVESLQPPRSRSEKWVHIVSSLFGCPVNCLMCDAGGGYSGNLTADEIIGQVNYLVNRRFPDGRVKTRMLKVQFARIGEPSFNPAVIDALERLPGIYGSEILNAAVSSIAPSTPVSQKFFSRLLNVKDKYYSGGRFQLQFSIHTTDSGKRDELIPAKKWTLEEIAEYGSRFACPENGDRKVTLNFAPVKGYPVDEQVIRRYFDPEKFVVKLTPLNPTVRSNGNELKSSIDPKNGETSALLVEGFKKEGFDVILSIGETEENKIGSNCGQYIQRALSSPNRPQESYETDRYKLHTA
jgi:23S rRNA (adenine2503-C2)-methyltransferase